MQTRRVTHRMSSFLYPVTHCYDGGCGPHHFSSPTPLPKDVIWSQKNNGKLEDTLPLQVQLFSTGSCVCSATSRETSTSVLPSSSSLLTCYHYLASSQRLVDNTNSRPKRLHSRTHSITILTTISRSLDQQAAPWFVLPRAVRTDKTFY